MSQSVPINMRADLAVRSLIDRAASLVHRNRTEFVLEAARQRAEEILLDQQQFVLDEAHYRRFIDALDAPPADNPRLRRLFERKAPWE